MRLKPFDVIKSDDCVCVVVPYEFPLPREPKFIMFEEFYSGLEPTVLLSIDFADCIEIGKETYHVLGFSKDSMEYETLEETTYKTIEELRRLYESLSF